MQALRTYALLYPPTLLLVFIATWVVGRLSLGYWPRPYLDDPQFIGPWVDVMCTITGLLVVIGSPTFAFAVLGLLYRAYRDEPQRRCLLCIAVLSTICMIATVLILWWDPLGFVAWYFD